MTNPTEPGAASVSEQIARVVYDFGPTVDEETGKPIPWEEIRDPVSGYAGTMEAVGETTAAILALTTPARSPGEMERALMLVRAQMMSGDYPVSRWEQDFATAIVNLMSFDIRKAAEAFCATPLPEGTCSDPCATMPDYAFPRSGTNLLSVDQAEQILRQILPVAALTSNANEAAVAGDGVREAALRIVTVERARHGLGPCAWSDLRAVDQDHYERLARAALSNQHGDK